MVLKIIALCVVCASLLNEAVEAREPDWDRLANAIYKAEGGAKTRHPYGILAKYKHTTPRQACINTIKHAWRDWESGKDVRGHGYLEFLRDRYCPIGAKNDPGGLNKHWLRNVRAFYE